MRNLKSVLIFAVVYICICTFVTLIIRHEVIEYNRGIESYAIHEVKHFIGDNTECEIIFTEKVKEDGDKSIFKVVTGVGDFYAVYNTGTKEWKVREVNKQIWKE